MTVRVFSTYSTLESTVSHFDNFGYFRLHLKLFSIQVALSATRKLRTLLKLDARLHDRPTLTAFPPSAHSAAVPLSGGCFRFFPPPGGFILLKQEIDYSEF